jgi:hypothetical protein
MKTTKLENLRACGDAIEYVKTCKSAKDAWINCSRGDWMLWLAKRLCVDDRKLTLAKASCANQVRHLMKDQRSLDALDACYRYANGEISREELNTYAHAYAAYAAAYAAYAAAAYAASAAYAAYAAAAYAASAAYDAYDAYAADDAYAAAYDAVAADAADARKGSLKKSADICREILTEEVLLKYKRCHVQTK